MVNGVLGGAVPEMVSDTGSIWPVSRIMNIPSASEKKDKGGLARPAPSAWGCSMRASGGNPDDPGGGPSATGRLR